MIRAPRLRSLVIAMFLVPLVHGVPVPVPKATRLSSEALLDLGEKLNQAIRDHQPKRAAYLLQKGARPDTVGDLGSPLQMAISHGDTAIFRLLLEAGADPRILVRDRILFPPGVREFGGQYWNSIPLLFEAAIQPNPAFAKTLLERGADPKIVKLGISAAIVAARFDNLSVFRLIVDSLGGMTIPESQRIAAHASLHGAFTMLDELRNRGIPSNPDSLCKGLALAIENRDTARLKAFLAHGAPLDPRSPTYFTPLLRAIEADFRQVFDLLLDKGANVDAQDKEGVSAVHLAAKKSDSTWLKRLLVKGADLHVTNSDGQNALYDASAENVPMLLAGRIKVDVLDKKRVSPLVSACRNSRWNVAMLLLEEGADVRPMSSGGQTALSCAIAAHRLDEARLILDHGGNINAVPPVGTTILQESIQQDFRNDAQELLWLLRHGADPSLPDSSKRTPVEMAAAMAKWVELALLVRHGAKDEIKPYAARLVAAAVELDNDSLLAILVNHGCSLDAPDTNLHMRFHSYARDFTYNEEPALIHAISNHRTARVASLLRHGANPNVSGRDGVPALLLAIRLYEIDVVKLLLEQRADVSKRDVGNDGIKEYLNRYPYPQMAELFPLEEGK